MVDVGAGSGFWRTLLGTRLPGVRVIAVDASAAMIARLTRIVRKKRLTAVHPQVAGAHMLPLGFIDVKVETHGKWALCTARKGG